MINCKDIANDIKNETKKELAAINEVLYKENNNMTPCLAIVQVGDNAASNNYIKGKIKDCEDVGIKTILHKLPETTDEEEISFLITNLNIDKDINGIIIQLPLPKHLNEEKIINLVSPWKDVDGFRADSPFIPCTPLGVLTLLERLNVDVKGKMVTLIGYGKLVNKPLFQLLSDRGATVCVCRSHTTEQHKWNLCTLSDIIVTATGKHGVLNISSFFYLDKDAPKDFYETYSDTDNTNPPIQPIIIDCGIQVINGKQYGDCDVNLYEEIDMITPRIGGMGLMTRAALLQNVLKSYKENSKLK